MCEGFPTNITTWLHRPLNDIDHVFYWNINFQLLFRKGLAAIIVEFLKLRQISMDASSRSYRYMLALNTSLILRIWLQFCYAFKTISVLGANIIITDAVLEPALWIFSALWFHIRSQLKFILRHEPINSSLFYFARQVIPEQTTYEHPLHNFTYILIHKCGNSALSTIRQ